MADHQYSIRDTIENRLFRRTEMITESGCWIWLGSIVDGYGHIKTPDDVIIKTHRLSWNIFKGPIPDGMCVLHKCDVRCCINPNHLFIGTKDDNNKDKMRKGRARGAAIPMRGENHATSKLTEEQALLIISAVGPQSRIAKEFGISQVTVCQIKSGARWKHLER